MAFLRQELDLEVSSPGLPSPGELLERGERDELNGFVGICIGSGLSVLFWAAFYLILRAI